MRRRGWMLALLLSSACGDASEPPSPRAEPHHLAPPPPAGEVRAAASTASAEPSEETVDAHDLHAELTSTARETSIYETPAWGGRRLGYLRAGSILARAEAPSRVDARCPGGWFRVAPRGFVCVGPMASTDLDAPVARAMRHPPKTDDLPYLYVMSRSPPPPLYARLPARADQIRFEPDLADHLADGPSGWLPPAEPLPDFLAPGLPSLSLGNEYHGPDRVMLGHAAGRSGFALVSTFDDGRGRRFGLSTNLEVLPLDRTKVVKGSAFQGAAIEDIGLPIGFARGRGAVRATVASNGELLPALALSSRQHVALTGETRLEGSTPYLVARDGSLVRARDVVVAKPFKLLPAWATGNTKWIDVSIPRQTLVAYRGSTPVYATLVSTGVGGDGDPETTHATIRGVFAIYEKHLAVTMGGHESDDAFDLSDVPFVQYFHEGFALHGVYWHDDFGHQHSHGCVNMSPRDAAWLFAFTDPHLPEAWHGVTTKAGTIVYVHD